MVLIQRQVDLYDFINHATLGSPNTDYRGKSGSSSWGWTDPDSKREFVGKSFHQSIFQNGAIVL